MMNAYIYTFIWVLIIHSNEKEFYIVKIFT